MPVLKQGIFFGVIGALEASGTNRAANTIKIVLATHKDANVKQEWRLSIETFPSAMMDKVLLYDSMTHNINNANGERTKQANLR